MPTQQSVLELVGDLIRDRTIATRDMILQPAFRLCIKEMAQKGALRKAMRMSSSFTLVESQAEYTFLDAAPTWFGLSQVPETIHFFKCADWGAGEEETFIDRRDARAFEIEMEARGGSGTEGRPYIYRYTPGSRGVEFFYVPDSDNADSVEFEWDGVPSALAVTDTITALTEAEESTMVNGILSKVGRIFEPTRELVLDYKNEFNIGMGHMLWDLYRDEHTQEAQKPNDLL